jgi:hypothetical protein
MASKRYRSRILVGLAVMAVATLAVGAGLGRADAGAATWAPPPANAAFDYQIGGAYAPPAGVTVVSRDHDVSPAAEPAASPSISTSPTGMPRSR